jgi:hypothetical protein
MLEHCLFVGIRTCLIGDVHLPIPDLDHDPSFHIVEDVIGYFAFWPWKQTVSFY